MLDNFESPEAKYRGAPLWSWNTRLTWPMLKHQIDVLKEMGMGGFTMHVRIGLDTPYLGDEFMDMIRKCVNYAKEKEMEACLYDEDRWPSGAAGGLAVKGHPEYKARHLLITSYKYGEHPVGASTRASAKASRSENGKLLARIELKRLPNDLVTYQTLAPDSEQPITEGTRYIYMETNPSSQWFNGETYADLLNPSAVKAFIDSTYELYKKTVGDEFGSAVPFMFTDEPQFSHQTVLPRAFDKADLFLPWTMDLPQTFSEAYAEDLLKRLPEVVWDTDNMEETRRLRWEFHDHVCERFVQASMDQLATWCSNAGIALTGHMMNEPTLMSQSMAVGEVMRCYRNMDVPGIDILCERVEFNTAKQASSVSRQQHGGSAWTMSEIYGVTNWTFTFASHKRVGDWQAALGINKRVHHLSPVSILGEAKRDYPAAINYQSSWYKEYSEVEDHFARVNLALTTGSAVTRVAVVHPIESVWLAFGPLERNRRELVMRDTLFRELSEWLLLGLVDFDFIAESLLPSQVGEVGQTLAVGHAKYEVVIVPNLRTIRSSTLRILQQFAEAGGKVIIAGNAPTLIDARTPSSPPIIPGASSVNMIMGEILEAVEPHRDVSAVTSDGLDATTLLYQLRDDQEAKILFVCNNSHTTSVESTLRVRGSYEVEVLDTLTGKAWTLSSEIVDGWTKFAWHFDGCASLLCRLTPPSVETGALQVLYHKNYKFAGPLKLNKIELSEPNVLLLDYAQFRVDEEDWSPITEILRIENIVRERLGYALKLEAQPQPWTISQEARKPEHTLSLRFPVKCLKSVSTALELAVEAFETLTLSFDGKKIENVRRGWWVDEGISRLSLCNGLDEGEHTLQISMPFGRLSSIERIYILGDFAVQIRGTEAGMYPLDKSTLSWGDYTRQGLPFYAGDVNYHCSFDLPTETPSALEVRQMRAPVTTALLDSKHKRTVAFPPYIADFGNLSSGPHEVVLTSYGNRENAFGCLHLAPGKTQWRGPNEWRTQHHEWMDEYDIKPAGILVAPQLKVPGKDHYIYPFENRDAPLHTAMSNPVSQPILRPMQY
ncbi:hypothetical protein BCR39DRAFT_543984 [Naematelia encephala]|uniref:Uncharacterized protein n=1 Tax=Naematelia encephala TaxID=71784 RepID=A0A1Y2ASN0_9TREE|nr:hypothetical protein BCR39DRAFT_543984 [Naematelia encephala]